MTVTRGPGLVLIALLAACASGSGSGGSSWPSTPRPLATIPQSARFRPDPAFHGSGTALRADACLTHLIDPTNGIRLTLVRSLGGEQHEAAQSAGVSANPQGDFSLEPPNQYGLRSGELLRVDCATGRAIGAVTK